MPCATVGVSAGIGGLGKGVMNAATVLDCRRVVRGRAYERMCELDTPARVQQSRVDSRPCHCQIEVEHLGGSVKEERVTQGLRRGGKYQPLRLVGKPLETHRETPLNPAHDRLMHGEAEPASDIRDAPRSRQLEERKWVAAALVEELLANRRVERALEVLQQHGARIAVAETADR